MHHRISNPLIHALNKMTMLPDNALVTAAVPPAVGGVVQPRQPGAVPRAITRMLERAQSLPHRPPGAAELSSDPSCEVSDVGPLPALTASVTIVTLGCTRVPTCCTCCSLAVTALLLRRAGLGEDPEYVSHMSRPAITWAVRRPHRCAGCRCMPRIRCGCSSQTRCWRQNFWLGCRTPAPW